MKQKGNILIIVLIMIVAVAVISYLIYQNMQLKRGSAVPIPSAVTTTYTATPASTPSVTPAPATSLKPGWVMYTNDQYGFEFTHPDTYKVLTDSENLYGWPKAILLLYKGGQSYDLAVEVWGSETEYKAKYTDSSMFSVYKTKDGKFITLLNQNKDPEVDEIIASFKFTQ